MRGSWIESGGGRRRGRHPVADAVSARRPSLPKDVPPTAPPVRRGDIRSHPTAAVPQIWQEIPWFDRATPELLNFRVSSEGFPSGQREQTVNLPALPSKVRILPPPPLQEPATGHQVSKRHRRRRGAGGTPAYGTDSRS